MIYDFPITMQEEILDVMKRENRTLLEAEAVVVQRKISGCKPERGKGV